RFYDGDPSNNTQCWDAQEKNVGDPAWRGDFKGLIEKLDYIKALGFTAIWITPIVENASGYDYHGYHAHDFSKVDHRYESTDVTLETLVNACHAKGIKLIVDIVLQHTGNFGEANLCKEFTRNWNKSQCMIDECMEPYTKSQGGKLPDNYLSLPGGQQYSARLSLMKNTTGTNLDTKNYWHHYGNFNWDDNSRWFAQIAGDCVDLNTENPDVYNYIVNCYKNFIALGVDAFRIDTGGHIPRLTFNKAFLPKFKALGEQYKNKRTLYGQVPANQAPFFMYAEVCARYGNIHYREHPALSCYYYTWKESKNYAWSEDPSEFYSYYAPEGDNCDHTTNWKSCWLQWTDDKDNIDAQPKSNNALLNGNTYHTPDYSKYSGLSVIDFPMHHNFESLSSGWGIASPDNDKFYNDATFNVTYVDSHDYAPNGAPEDKRFSQGEQAWAEDLALLFTYRGIPCIYYGSEIQFRAGAPIDQGTNMPLDQTGRAYFGGYIKGSANVTDFGVYSGATGNMAKTLSHPLAQHIQRLNLIRQAVPALRKGQYSREGCNGSFAFKRRYKDNNTDSFVLVCINGGATFSGLPKGTYRDCVTGDTKSVSEGGSLTASCSGRGNMRVYVLDGPGKIGEDGKYLYGSSARNIPEPTWDGTQEEKTTSGATCEKIVSPVVTMSPASGTNVGVDGKVTLSATRGVIYYTTNGSTPSASSTRYTSPIVISTNKTVIKAIAIDGTETSNIATGTYYTHEMPTVSLSPAGGFVGLGGTVTISSNISGADIYYTTNGTKPTTSSTKYTSPVAITQNETTLKAIAVYQGDESEVASGVYLTEKPKGVTIEFKAPSDWSSCYFYVWNTNGALLGKWPGKSITKDAGTGRYTYTVEADASQRPISVVFNVGSDAKQSADITGLTEDEYCYDGTNMGQKGMPAVCGEQPTPPTPPTPGNAIRVKVRASGFYASVKPYIHYWNNGSETSWPGVEMQKAEGWWYYDVPTSTGTCSVIFNNGSGTQTADIVNLTSDVCFSVSSNGTSYSSENCDDTPTPPAPTEYTQIGLKKSGQYASTTPYLYAWTGDGDTATKLVGNWPGTPMISQDANWWYYNVPSTGSFKIIFNIGSSDVQTDDIPVSGKTCFEVTGSGKGDYINVDCSGLVNADEAQAESSKIEAYPNPTTGWVTVEAGKEISAMKALSTSGAAVAASNGAEIDLSGAAAGLYLLGIQFEDGTFGFTKVIKK
ncbi:MAG: starch-binding protein, partial [Paludibacteraceae bacterium]|nr:starch-binding protein [Paludibacteraceae bacterium]